MSRLRWILLATVMGLLSTQSVRAVELTENATDTRTFQTKSQVRTTGQVFTLSSEGKKDPLALSATAQLQFRSRRLPPGGRDAEALRAVREFEVARVDTEVSGFKTAVVLPAQLKTVVAFGTREGVRSYCPEVLMTREALDLLEMPGDPLALIALLPLESVEVGGTWSPNEWAIQMLSGVEAAESSKMTCTLESADQTTAVFAFTGDVTGQRLGAVSTVQFTGRVQYNVAEKFISAAKLRYSVKSEVGTINPGLEAQVDVDFTRGLSNTPGMLTDAYLQNIPLNAPETALELVFDAVPWGLRLLHGRGWHLFQAVLESTESQHAVAILRLVDQGALVSQCNIAPVTNVQPGKRTPPQEFERDIQISLGSRLTKLSEQEDIPTSNGRYIYRVVAEGEVEISGDKGGVKIPMNWIYYLCTNSDGRQVSFVFAVEPELRETLGQQDRNIVTSASFFAVPQAGR
ncbi:MAG: hypothetical protein R3C18_00755 [Planctomycetaceae bacterium]